MYAVSASALFLVVVLSGALSGSWQDSASRAKDEAAVRTLVKEYVGARERGDPAAVGALFTSDADQLVSSADVTRSSRARSPRHSAQAAIARLRSRRSASPQRTSPSPTVATKSSAAPAGIDACGRPS